MQTLKKFKQVLDFRLREVFKLKEADWMSWKVTDSLKPKEDMIGQLHLCSLGA